MPELSLPKIIQQFLLGYIANHFSPNQPVLKILLGVSGGPDSVALLHAIAALAQTTQLPLQLEVGHLNHLIRGENAAADARYVENLCQQLQIKCHSAKYDVPAFATKHKLSIEDAARRARFAFFAELLIQSEGSLLLLAHTADDQAETMLMRLLRGTGPHGLGGIAPLAPLPPPNPCLIHSFDYDAARLQNILVGRPLLSVWRKQIEIYCATHKLAPRHDETNSAPTYTRNRVRLELLPYLETHYKPSIKINLTRLANLMRDEQALLDQLTETEFQQHAIIASSYVKFETSYFRTQSIALQRRLLRRAYLQLSGTLENIDVADIEPILSQLVIIRHLPGGIIGFADDKAIGLRKPQIKLTKTEAVLELIPPGVLNSEQGWQIWAEIMPRQQLDLATLKSADKNRAYLDYDRTGPRLLVRWRKPGEKFQPLGAPGRRKVQDIMLDAKIAPELRTEWPLVVQPATKEMRETNFEAKSRAEVRSHKENLEIEATTEAIIWLPGVAIAEEFKVTEATKTLLFLRFVPLISE